MDDDQLMLLKNWIGRANMVDDLTEIRDQLNEQIDTIQSSADFYYKQLEESTLIEYRQDPEMYGGII